MESDGDDNDPTMDVDKDSAQPLSTHEKKQLKVLTPLQFCMSVPFASDEAKDS